MRVKQLATVPFVRTVQFFVHAVMYICTTRYLRKAIQHIVSEISCGFSFFPHFQITFPSAIRDFKFFSQNISNKTISSENQVLLENLEIQKCPPVTQKISIESLGQILLISGTIYLELISRNSLYTQEITNMIKCIITFLLSKQK